VLGGLARSRYVTRPDRWLLDRARRVRGPRSYRLRESGFGVRIEHRTNDVSALDEVWALGEYVPPPPIAARLDAAAPLRVLDLGAHVGLAALWFLARWPGSRVTSVEADPRHLASLREARALNPGQDWEIVAGVAANQPGTVRFRAGLQMGSHVGGEGEALAAIDVLPLIAQADLVKCDVEGSEWALLADPRLAEGGPAVLVVEVHPSPEVPDPVARGAELLRAAGFEVDPGGTKPGGLGLLWAWR
jgi:FkbM family methyltransferase